ncbi:MAG TPA: zinc ABC transporter substrate-binding protein, partial [Methylomirabilota bacterium]|nr:zinc ABC transporter substrate-binding protein [Methylomirabilota bacterium]
MTGWRPGWGAPSLVGVALALWGCGEAPAPADTPLVVASVYPVYEFTRMVAGDDAHVLSLAPAGVEPHDWEPSPQDLVRVERARLFVYNGAGLEPWAERVAAERAARGLATVKATAGITVLMVPDGGRERG